MSVNDYSDYNARKLLRQTAGEPAGMPALQFEDLPGTSRRIRESVIANELGRTAKAIQEKALAMRLRRTREQWAAICRMTRYRRTSLQEAKAA